MKQQKVERRNDKFAKRTVTRIWHEEPSKENPYLAETCLCHGYDLQKLMKKRSFIDVLYLLFRGELPDRDQADLLENLMIAFINPGPRHPATRAAMNAGVGKTNVAHILPISLSVLGGDHLGGGEVIAAMRFIKKHFKKDPEKIASDLAKSSNPPDKGDWHIAPGFGCRFNGIDPMPQKIAAELSALPGSDKALAWGNAFAEALKPQGQGWLSVGVCAAVFCDLGFSTLVGAGLFQLICAPGLLAHGAELSGVYVPLTAMPFLDQKHYIIAPEARGKKENTNE